MPAIIDPKKVVQEARKVAGFAADDIAKTHGPIWAGRDELAKLTLSLSSAILVGTISFAEQIIGAEKKSCLTGYLLLGSWVLFFISICLGLFALWRGNVLRSFMARFNNSTPTIEQEAAALRAETPEQLVKETLEIVRKHSDDALQPLSSADRYSEALLKWSLISFVVGLAVFIGFGYTIVT